MLQGGAQCFPALGEVIITVAPGGPRTPPAAYCVMEHERKHRSQMEGCCLAAHKCRETSKDPDGCDRLYFEWQGANTVCLECEAYRVTRTCISYYWHKLGCEWGPDRPPHLWPAPWECSPWCKDLGLQMKWSVTYMSHIWYRCPWPPVPVGECPFNEDGSKKPWATTY